MNLLIELKNCKMIFKCKHNELCKCGNKAEIMWLTDRLKNIGGITLLNALINANIEKYGYSPRYKE